MRAAGVRTSLHVYSSSRPLSRHAMLSPLIICSIPCHLSHAFATLTPHAPVTLSRPEVGSSRNSNLGRVSNSMATHRRLRSPPLMPFFMGLPTMTLRTCASPTCMR